jgi:hypothetical protein
MRFLLPLLVLLPLAAACETVNHDPVGDDGIVLSQRCSNPRHGFSVSYPAGWHTNSDAVVPLCTAFDPEPIEIPPHSEMPFDIAVVIDVEDVGVDLLTQPSRFEWILSSERLTVDGRDAWRVEAEATGEGLPSAGFRSLRYVVDLGDGRNLIATTHDTDPGDYQRDQEVLRQMVQSLDLP